VLIIACLCRFWLRRDWKCQREIEREIIRINGEDPYIKYFEMMGSYEDLAIQSDSSIRDMMRRHIKAANYIYTQRFTDEKQLKVSTAVVESITSGGVKGMTSILANILSRHLHKPVPTEWLVKNDYSFEPAKKWITEAVDKPQSLVSKLSKGLCCSKPASIDAAFMAPIHVQILRALLQSAKSQLIALVEYRVTRKRLITLSDAELESKQLGLLTSKKYYAIQNKLLRQLRKVQGEFEKLDSTRIPHYCLSIVGARVSRYLRINPSPEDAITPEQLRAIALTDAHARAKALWRCRLNSAVGRVQQNRLSNELWAARRLVWNSYGGHHSSGEGSTASSSHAYNYYFQRNPCDKEAGVGPVGRLMRYLAMNYRFPSGQWRDGPQYWRIEADLQYFYSIFVSVHDHSDSAEDHRRQEEHEQEPKKNLNNVDNFIDHGVVQMEDWSELQKVLGIRIKPDSEDDHVVNSQLVTEDSHNRNLVHLETLINWFNNAYHMKQRSVSRKMWVVLINFYLTLLSNVSNLGYYRTHGRTQMHIVARNMARVEWRLLDKCSSFALEAEKLLAEEAERAEAEAQAAAVAAAEAAAVAAAATAGAEGNDKKKDGTSKKKDGKSKDADKEKDKGNKDEKDKKSKDSKGDKGEKDSKSKDKDKSKVKDAKESKGKDEKDAKGKDGKDHKNKDSKDAKGKDSKDAKGKDGKDSKSKDKDKKDKKSKKVKEGAEEEENEDHGDHDDNNNDEGGPDSGAGVVDDNNEVNSKAVPRLSEFGILLPNTRKKKHKKDAKKSNTKTTARVMTFDEAVVIPDTPEDVKTREIQQQSEKRLESEVKILTNVKTSLEETEIHLIFRMEEDVAENKCLRDMFLTRRGRYCLHTERVLITKFDAMMASYSCCVPVDSVTPYKASWREYYKERRDQMNGGSALAESLLVGLDYLMNYRRAGEAVHDRDDEDSSARNRYATIAREDGRDGPTSRSALQTKNATDTGAVGWAIILALFIHSFDTDCSGSFDEGEVRLLLDSALCHLQEKHILAAFPEVQLDSTTCDKLVDYLSSRVHWRRTWFSTSAVAAVASSLLSLMGLRSNDTNHVNSLIGGSREETISISRRLRIIQAASLLISRSRQSARLLTAQAVSLVRTGQLLAQDNVKNEGPLIVRAQVLAMRQVHMFLLTTLGRLNSLTIRDKEIINQFNRMVVQRGKYSQLAIFEYAIYLHCVSTDGMLNTELPHLIDYLKRVFNFRVREEKVYLVTDIIKMLDQKKNLNIMTRQELMGLLVVLFEPIQRPTAQPSGSPTNTSGKNAMGSYNTTNRLGYFSFTRFKLNYLRSHQKDAVVRMYSTARQQAVLIAMRFKGKGMVNGFADTNYRCSVLGLSSVMTELRYRDISNFIFRINRVHDKVERRWVPKEAITLLLMSKGYKLQDLHMEDMPANYCGIFHTDGTLAAELIPVKAALHHMQKVISRNDARDTNAHYFDRIGRFLCDGISKHTEYKRVVRAMTNYSDDVNGAGAHFLNEILTGISHCSVE
jgi:hypothetical protein